MPCEWLEKDGVVIHINRGRGRGPRRTCKFCHQDYYGGKLCDFPVGDGRTCDAEMCDKCARTLGRQNTEIGSGLKRLNDTIDVCPLHRGKAVAEGGKIRAEAPDQPRKTPPAEESSGFPQGQQGTLPFETTSPKNPRG
jgi:hypothetical protein